MIACESTCADGLYSGVRKVERCSIQGSCGYGRNGAVFGRANGRVGVCEVIARESVPS